MNLHMAVEHWEEECGCRRPSEGARSPSPKQGLPSNRFQSKAKEFPQNLTKKLVRILASWMRWKEPENLDNFFKGLMHRLILT